MNFKDHIKDVTIYFKEFGNNTDAQAQKKYMKNQFEFCGIKTPIRRKLQKEMNEMLDLQTDDFLPFVQEAYASKYRDLHHYALDTVSSYQSIYDSSIIPVVEYLVCNNSWWDTVDGTNSFISKHYFLKNRAHHKEVVQSWMVNENIWLRRSAIISQLKFKDKTDEALLEEVIACNLGSKEFFIDKAIGWSLREYSRTCADFVVNICEKYSLSKLSEREALRLLS